MSDYPVPFDHALFPDIGPMVAGRGRKVSERLVARAPVMVQSALRVPEIPDAFVTELWIAAADDPGVRSQSFHNRKPERDAPLDPRQHFHFIPGIDDVEVRWTVREPDRAKQVRFELWSAVDPSGPVWSMDLADGEAVAHLQGKNPWSWSEIRIDGDDVRFPGRCPNVAFAPYQLRMIVTSELGTVTTAWTYFDVVVARIEIRYGTEAMIPAGHIGDVLPVCQAMTDRDERQLLQDLRAGGLDVPADGTIALPLKSTQAAYVHFEEWYTWRDMAYSRHEARWGEGPRIPLVAKVYLRDIDGQRRHSAQAARALGPAKFLWDWHDRSAAERDDELADADARTQAFVRQALQHAPNSPDEPPDCLNCHADRGGKRGSGLKIFPATAATAEFPFDVTIAATRTWASLSTAAVDGPYAGYTGAIFQPSRMALDTYKLRVMLATPLKPDRSAPSVDDAADVTTLLDDHRGLPVAETGFFEVRRRIDARYVRKSAATDPMDLALLARMYAVGGLDIVWTQEFWDPGDYRTRFTEASTANPDHIDHGYVRDRRYGYNFNARQTKIRQYLATRNGAHLTTFDQWSGEPAGAATDVATTAQFTLPLRDRVIATYMQAVLQPYIDKPRKINDKKRKWKKIRRRYPQASLEEQYSRFYHEALTAEERAQFEDALKAAFEADGWRSWDEPAENMVEWAGDNYYYDFGFGDFLQEVHQRAILASPFEGVTFFHYTHMYEAVDFDGNIARQCELGGLAAVTMSADLGFKGAFIVWDHPTNMQRQELKHALLRKKRTFEPGWLTEPGALYKDGNFTAIHEFGHFMHLSHARPTGGPLEAAVHDQSDAKCVMNYDHDGLHLCGGCALRMRGWSFFDHGGVKGFSRLHPDQDGVNPPAPTTGGIPAIFNALYTDFA